MKLAINDISFRHRFYSLDEAFEKLHEFLNLCKEIERGNLKHVEGIYAADIDSTWELCKGYKLIKIMQQFKTKDEQRYLLGILTNRSIPQDDLKEQCIVGEYKSRVCAWAKDGVVLSLQSAPDFCESIILGMIGKHSFRIKNISEKKHIDIYRMELGKRIYHANDKKHKFGRVNSYGKGKTASPMSLAPEAAQILLDQAIEIKGRLYAKCGNKYFAFQNEQDVIYHGYECDDLSDDIRMRLDAIEWPSITY